MSTVVRCRQHRGVDLQRDDATAFARRPTAKLVEAIDLNRHGVSVKAAICRSRLDRRIGRRNRRRRVGQVRLQDDIAH
jgi:hypothetical protein